MGEWRTQGGVPFSSLYSFSCLLMFMSLQGQVTHIISFCSISSSIGRLGCLYVCSWWGRPAQGDDTSLLKTLIFDPGKMKDRTVIYTYFNKYASRKMGGNQEYR